MYPPARILILLGLILGPYCTPVRGDGGMLRLVERQGDYRISVFTSPNPLRAGPVDISVLLQDAVTGQPVTDARVRVSLTPGNSAGSTASAEATLAGATNKLLRAALIDLPEPGWWYVDVNCLAEGDAVQVHFAMDAGRPLPRWLTVWPWFSWPAGAVILLGIHRLLVLRKQSRHRERTRASGSDIALNTSSAERGRSANGCRAGKV